MRKKYLKARLQEAVIPIPYTHDLVVLLNLTRDLEPTWTTLEPDLRALTVFAVTFRYPGSSADRAIAREAFVRCQVVRQTVRLSLGFVP